MIFATTMAYVYSSAIMGQRVSIGSDAPINDARFASVPRQISFTQRKSTPKTPSCYQAHHVTANSYKALREQISDLDTQVLRYQKAPGQGLTLPRAALREMRHVSRYSMWYASGILNVSFVVS